MRHILQNSFSETGVTSFPATLVCTFTTSLLNLGCFLKKHPQFSEQTFYIILMGD